MDSLVLDECELLLRFSQLHIRSDATSVEDGLRNLRDELPNARRAREQAAQLIALKPQQAGERDARKVGGLGDPNDGVGRHEILLGRADVRSSLE